MDGQNRILKKWLSRGRADGVEISYSRLLRVIGQELEAKGIATCCLWTERDRFDVIGLRTGGAVEASFWQRLRAKQPAPGYATVELNYSIEALLRLDELNQAKRTLAIPRSDFRTLSEQLRTIGAVVDRRAGQLIRLERVAHEGMIASLAVQYQMATGELMTEEFSAPSLYDFSVQIFMMEKRRMQNRASVSRAA